MSSVPPPPFPSSQPGQQPASGPPAGPDPQPYGAPQQGDAPQQAPSAGAVPPPAGVPSPGAQQAYPAGPSYPGASAAGPSGGSSGGSKKWLPWVLGGCGCLLLVAILAVAAIIGLSLLGGAGNPEDTARDFAKAMQEKDCTELRSLTTEDFWDGQSCEKSLEAASKFFTIEKFEVIDSEVDGDTADVNVRVTGTFQGHTSTSTSTMHMVKDDGRWKVDGTTGDTTGS